MANIIRAVFGLFWLIATSFLAFLAYIVIQTEGNPQALSAWLAIKDALSAIRNHTVEPDFAIPATNEVIVMTAEKMRKSN